jgi:hypothetical protein
MFAKFREEAVSALFETAFQAFCNPSRARIITSLMPGWANVARPCLKKQNTTKGLGLWLKW